MDGWIVKGNTDILIGRHTEIDRYIDGQIEEQIGKEKFK